MALISLNEWRQKHTKDYDHGKGGYVGGNPRYGKKRGYNGDPKKSRSYVNDKDRKTNFGQKNENMLRRGMLGAAAALGLGFGMPTTAQAQNTADFEKDRIEALANHAKTNKLYLNAYIEEVLSSGQNLFQGKKNIDGYDVTIHTYSGNQKGNFGTGGAGFEPKKDDPTTYKMRMDFVITFDGNNLKTLTNEKAVEIARKAVEQLNNPNESILGKFAFRPKFDQKGFDYYKPSLSRNRVRIPALGEIKDPYRK